jgi:hypothetical protein
MCAGSVGRCARFMRLGCRCLGVSRRHSALCYALREPIQRRCDLFHRVEAKPRHRVVEDIPIKVLKLSGFCPLNPILHGWAYGIHRCADNPANESHPPDDRACGSVHLADQTPTCASGDKGTTPRSRRVLAATDRSSGRPVRGQPVRRSVGRPLGFRDPYC